MVFFVASAGTISSGEELFVTDGTGPGTVHLDAILPGPGSPSASELTAVGDALFLRADNGGGPALWTSDGTIAGTEKVGPDGMSPSSIADLNGVAMFSADDGVSGVELWRSDGTVAGTVQIEDLISGVGSSNAFAFGALGDRALVSADHLADGAPGAELFAALDTIAPQTSITSGPAEGSTTEDPTPSFGFSSDDSPSSFQCSLDGGAFSACSGPGDAHTTSALAEGAHTFAVRATDFGGNLDASPATRSFIVDAPEQPGPVPDPGPGDDGGPPADGAVEGAVIKAKKKQPQTGDEIKVKLKASAQEAVSLFAKGKASVPGSGRVKLKTEPLELAAGEVGRVTLEAKPEDSEPLLKGLDGDDGTAKVKVSLTDAAGNVAVLKAKVRLTEG